MIFTPDKISFVEDGFPSPAVVIFSLSIGGFIKVFPYQIMKNWKARYSFVPGLGILGFKGCGIL